MQKSDREAFIALIAPIGIDINQVVDVLSEKASQIKYEPNIIKMTDFLRDFGDVKSNYPNEVERYKDYIKAGDDICEEAGRGDILAMLSVSKIMRGGPEKRMKDIQKRRINIFRQIKRLEEYNTLERIYGRNILFVGCFAPKSKRVSYLVDRIRVSDRSSNESFLESQALEIISTDEDEAGKKFGQRVIDCYPKSDFIIDCSDLKSLNESCERLFQIYFGHPFISPTRDEYSSYIANAAAYRSLDLSRQVGAAIFGEKGEIISMGCNEVPAAGGGTYWCDQHNDHRDFVLGYDSNQRVKEDLARDAIVRLRNQGWISSDYTQLPVLDIVEALFKKADHQNGIPEGPWASAMISSIIEFGRMVHAEMNAITDAARFNRSTIGATLYCTTMPCHMCTKLIIAAGIKRVVYVQPYIKSLTSELFKDSVSFEDGDSSGKVNFVSLKGVTPAGFKRAFSKEFKRKDERGFAKNWDKLNARPVFLSTVPYYENVELDVLEELQSNPIMKRVSRD